MNVRDGMGLARNTLERGILLYGWGNLNAKGFETPLILHQKIFIPWGISVVGLYFTRSIT